MSGNFTTAIPGGINLGLIEYCLSYLWKTAIFSGKHVLYFKLKLEYNSKHFF